MATTTLKTWFLGSVIFLIESVTAYYCDNDQCKEGEYCCGNNICCASYTVWELWYFWLGIVFFIVLFCLCICLWKSRYRDRRILMAYSLMSAKQQQANMGGRFSDTLQDTGKQTQGKYHHLQQSAPPTYDEVINEYKGPLIK